jgi:antitoxin (DNA-binding transcriptional repressor) of toxin-antitoxin stability system
MSIVKINDIKDQVEELITRVQAGETILIEKDGQTVARIERIATGPATSEEGRKFDWEALKQFTDSLPPAKQSAADLIRQMRDESY